jgi:hypothetical protein
VFTDNLRPPSAADHNSQRFIEAGGSDVVWLMVEVLVVCVHAMELITIPNRCHRSRGFVYHYDRFSPDQKSIEVAVRPRKGSAAICSRCHQPAPGYDQLAERRFEFIPLWGFLVFKRTLTKAYMLFLARSGWPCGPTSNPCRKPPAPCVSIGI